MDVVKANEWIVITDQSNSHCRLEYVDAKNENLVFHRKWAIPTKFLVGLPYGSCITIGPSGDWICCSRISIDSIVERVLARLHELGVGSGNADSGGEENDDLSSAPPVDYARCSTGARGSQKLTSDEVIARKTDGMPLFDLIVELCAGAESFGSRSIYSQEKYIRKKLGRHLLLLSIQKVTVSTAHQAYMGLGSGLKSENGNTSCSSKTSAWIPLETLSTLLNDADITAGRRVLVVDQYMGILTGAVMARLLNKDNELGSQLIFSSELRGTSSYILNQMNFDQKDLKLIYQEIPHVLLKAANSAQGNFHHESIKQINPIFFGGPIASRIISQQDLPPEKLAQARQQRQLRIDQRLNCWNILAERKLDSLVAATNNTSFVDNDVRAIANCLGDIYNIALYALKPDGRLVIYNNAMQPLADLFAFIKARKHTWCNCSFVEICHRRICTLPGRSHPQMDANMRFSHGFILSATRMINTELNPTHPDDHALNSTEDQMAKLDNNLLEAADC